MKLSRENLNIICYMIKNNKYDGTYYHDKYNNCLENIEGFSYEKVVILDDEWVDIVLVQIGGIDIILIRYPDYILMQLYNKHDNNNEFKYVIDLNDLYYDMLKNFINYVKDIKTKTQNYLEHSANKKLFISMYGYLDNKEDSFIDTKLDKFPSNLLFEKNKVQYSKKPILKERRLTEDDKK